MAWTDSEEQRIEAIEKLLNSLQTAMLNLASKIEMRQLLLIKQQEVDNLKGRVEALESQVTVIQDKI